MFSLVRSDMDDNGQIKYTIIRNFATRQEAETAQKNYVGTITTEIIEND